MRWNITNSISIVIRPDYIIYKTQLCHFIDDPLSLWISSWFSERDNLTINNFPDLKESTHKPNTLQSFFVSS